MVGFSKRPRGRGDLALASRANNRKTSRPLHQTEGTVLVLTGQNAWLNDKNCVTGHSEISIVERRPMGGQCPPPRIEVLPYFLTVFDWDTVGIVTIHKTQFNTFSILFSGMVTFWYLKMDCFLKIRVVGGGGFRSKFHWYYSSIFDSLPKMTVRCLHRRTGTTYPKMKLIQINWK